MQGHNLQVSSFSEAYKTNHIQNSLSKPFFQGEQRYWAREATQPTLMANTLQNYWMVYMIVFLLVVSDKCSFTHTQIDINNEALKPDLDSH